MDDIVAQFGRLRAWVARERRRLATTGNRPTQRYLRRARLCAEIDARILRDLVRELHALTREKH